MSFKKKFIKFKLSQKILAFIGYLYILFVCFTSKIYERNSGIPEKMWNEKKPFILAFWHSQLMMIGHIWKHSSELNVLASSHSDGRFGSYLGSYFKLNNIPIKSNNKSSSLRTVFKILNDGKYIGITPDGPRGPNKKVSEGIIKIAIHSKVPIIPLGFASNKNLRLNSWDSFLITFPFSKCTVVWGKPITIPASTKESDLKQYMNFLEERINDCINSAEKNLNV